MSTKTALQCIRNKKLLLLVPGELTQAKTQHPSPRNHLRTTGCNNHWSGLGIWLWIWRGVNREDSDTEYQPGSSSDDSQWDDQITTSIQTQKKVSKPSLLNVIFTNQICKASVRRSVNPMHAATNGSSSFNLTLLSRSLLFKRPLKLLGICALFCWNSIVNWTPLSISGGWWKNTFMTIVITHLMGWRKIYQRHWIWYPYRPSDVGNIGCFIGWELIGQDLGWFRCSYRWRNSGSTNHTGIFQRM